MYKKILVPTDGTTLSQRAVEHTIASPGRRGLSALVLGSETQKVLAHGTLPVLVLR